MTLIIPIFIIGLLLDWYTCRAVRTRCRHSRKLWYTVSLVQSCFFALVLLGLIVWPKKSTGDGTFEVLMWTLYAWISVYVPKAIWVLFDLIAKIPQLWHSKRWKWVGLCGWIGVPVFIFMWWGALVERYRIEVKNVEIVSPELPSAFDGFTIAQFSDIHLGTYGNDTTFVKKVVDRINSLHPDMIVFTGDIVNRRSSEMEPFVRTLSGLYAPYGVYSILGNHDYGDYYSWPSQSDKIENMALLYQLQQDAGLRMLNNNSEYIYAGTDSIALIGVENIGDPPFPVYGNLDMAYPGDLADSVFKILLSHNPAHWTADIADAPDKNIALTLSGHTHAMQMEFFGWSPAVWRYPKWGGLYCDDDGSHRMYVNIGIGEVGIPARLGGATPEI
ncbi:MAG: metallophosphoesterase, partial [Roseburia sp.]|nr:metallophosphoesterase [Roseburia sp.]